MIKRLSYIVLAVFMSLSTAVPSFAEGSYAFQHLTTANGLTSNTAMFCVHDDFGFIWVATKDNIFRYDGREFEPLEKIDPKADVGGNVFAMTIDPNGVIWYSTDRKIGYYNTYTNESGSPDFPQTEVYYTICPDYGNNIWFSGLNTTVRYNLLTHQAETLEIKSAQSSQHIAATPDNNVWIIGDQGEILRYNNRTGAYVTIPFLTDQEIASGKSLVRIVDTGNGIMLVSDNTGRIYKYDTWTEGRQLFSAHLTEINYIKARSANEIWAGNAKGLYIMNGSGEIVDFISDHQEYELSNCIVMSIHQDHDDNMWVCTYHGGLNLLTNDKKGIRLFPNLSSRSQVNGRLVRTITADKLGDLWIGTVEGCLCLYSPTTGSMTDISALNNLSEYNYHCLLSQGSEMWAATYDNGVMVFDAVSGGYLRKYNVPNYNSTYIFKSREGITYLGTTQGILQFHPESDSFILLPETEGLFVRHMMQDSYGTIWVSCFGQGIWHKRGISETFRKIMGTDTYFPLRSEYISYMFQDDHNRMWAATEGRGVFYFSMDDPDSNLVYFDREDGLPSDIACAIIQDKSSRIWISSTMGLAEIDGQTATLKHTYLDNSTILNKSFSLNAIYLAQDGQIYLGTYTGMVAIDPEELSDTEVSPNFYIKRVYVRSGAGDIQFMEEGKSQILTDHIKIHQRDASALNIDFCSPGFSSLSTPRYEYSLKGAGTNLTNTTSNSSIVLNNLKPGRYTFTAGISGKLSPDLDKKMEIEVMPYFFNSPVAKLLYALLAALALVFVIRQIRQKRKGEQMLVFKEMEKNKQKELYDARVSFFSYITHELRTPLTLIKLPVDKLIETKGIPSDAKEDLLTIKSNTDRLIELSGQFLEMSKMNSSDMQLTYDNVDVRKVVQKVCDYFPSAIKERGIDMKVHLPSDPLWINTAPEAVEKIVTNLVSNAVKYCKSSIDVSLSRQQNDVVVKVDSDGTLLTAENAERIFDPFFRLSSEYSEAEGFTSAGLGLALSRNLAVALGGSLGVDLNVKDCNSFVLTFPANPIQADAPLHEGAPLASETAVSEEEEDSYEGQRILIVEDAQDLRDYIAKELSQSYTVLTAGNGKEALGIIRSQKVDMVISDIMMPLMDGRELCRTIKNDTDLSYIPVILLTAIAGPDSQISSLEAGADSYIEKPFSIELLKASVQSLFHSREIMYKQFSESPLTHFKSVSGNKVDQEFMDSLREIIFEHMSDENLDVEMLTELMHTSTSTLYRKVKANTGLKVNEYIKICRLKKAAELLAEGKYKINEVAYLTGFSSASYFATSFLKQFNISPSNFVKKIRDDGSGD